MNRLENRSGSLGLREFLSVFLFCLLLSSSVVFVFQYFYFPVRHTQLVTAEMQDVFGEEEFFDERSRSILDTRNGVGYVRLLDRNGVLERSFGVQYDRGFEKITLKGPEGKTVLVGVKALAGNRIYFDMLLWSLAVGSLMAVVLFFFLRAMNYRSFRFLEEFSDAMKHLSDGDRSVRLDAGSSIMANPGVARLCDEFNEMVRSLAPAAPGEDGEWSPGDEDSEVSASGSVGSVGAEVPPPAVREDSAARGEKPPASFLPKIVFGAPEKETVSAEDSLTARDERRPQDGETGISVLVAKIADFETLVHDLEPSEVNSLTTEYRKSLSNFVVSLGGVVEAMLRDEVVAFFSVPGAGGRKAAALRSVCSAVEIMQFFGGAEDLGGVTAKARIKIKIGISSADVRTGAESGIFAEAKPFVTEAKALCDGARDWNILVTQDFRETVKDYLEVRRESVGGQLCYAVTSVEEDAIGAGGA